MPIGFNNFNETMFLTSLTRP